MNPLFKSNFIQILEQFVSLNELSSKRCNDSSAYYTLMRNYMAIGSNNTRRVNKIFNQVASKRAINCRDEYPREFEQVYVQMDKDKVRRVETFLATLVKRRRLQGGRNTNDTDRIAYIEFASKVNSLGDREAAEAAREALVLLKPSSSSLLGPDSWKSTVDGKQLGPIIEEFLVEPCEYYIVELKATLDPVQFDAIFIGPDDRQDSKVVAMREAQANYRLCRLLEKSHKDKLVSQLVSLLAAKPEPSWYRLSPRLNEAGHS